MIPVIGARQREAQIHAVTIQAVITCGCTSDHPLVIAGIDRRVTCPTCGSVYVIQEIAYAVDTETGDATLRQAIAQVHDGRV
jgi:hypothetical protein